MAPCEPRDAGESGELLNKFSGYRWPGNNHIPRPILGVSAAAEEPLPRVHVAFVGDGGDDGRLPLRTARTGVAARHLALRNGHDLLLGLVESAS